MKVLCTRCSYRFEAKGLGDSCPYCGEKKTLIELEDAENILEKL